MLTESSIIADLRFLAGPIIAKPVYSEDNIPEEKNARGRPKKHVVQNTVTENKNPVVERKRIETPEEDKTQPAIQKPRISKDSQLTIEEVALLITQPLSAVRNGKNLIYDKSTIVARCDKGHIHKYYIKDIVENAGYSKCETCSNGNKFANMVRTITEETLGVPFILQNRGFVTKHDASLPAYSGVNLTEFMNPLLKIHIACYHKNRDGGGNAFTDSSTRIDENFIIRIHNTTSAKKIKDSLYLFLNSQAQLFDQETQKRISKLHIDVKKKKQNLPITPELAKEIWINDADQRNVITEECDSFRLENCGIPE